MVVVAVDDGNGSARVALGCETEWARGGDEAEGEWKDVQGVRGIRSGVGEAAGRQEVAGVRRPRAGTRARPPGKEEDDREEAVAGWAASWAAGKAR